MYSGVVYEGQYYTYIRLRYQLPYKMLCMWCTYWFTYGITRTLLYVH